MIISKAEGAVYPTSSNVYSLGRNNALWSQVFAAQGTINTSDRRKKTDIQPISDAVLDAWAEVEPKSFKMVDAVKEKGDKARTHFGYVAQDVEEAFTKHGIDPYQFGILCKMKTPAKEAQYNTVKVIDTPAVTDDEGNIVKEATYREEKMLIQEAQEAEEYLGIRYEEAYLLDIAILKRKLK